MPMIQSRPFQRGTTLVEALIAAVIIAIGLLGIAVLQVKSLQASTNAEYRAKAVDIASSLADRMQANLIADTASGNDYISTTPLSACPAAPAQLCSMTPGASSVSGVSSCTPTQMAAFDLYEARCATTGVKQVLPGGSLTVRCIDSVAGNADACDPGSEMRITVNWDTRTETLDTGSKTDFITLAFVPGADPLLNP